MGLLTIVKPERPTAIVSGTLGRLLSPDPKEAAATAASGGFLTVDFGAPVTIDSAFLGYHNAASGQGWAVNALTDQLQVISALFGVQPLGATHGFRMGAPLTARYWQLQINGGPQNVAVTAGVFALGLSFQASWGHEFGAGRLIQDTGTAERLFGGGFGIDDGVAAGGYAWTFGDLQPDEIRRLYQIVKDRRTTRSVLVVEDPDQTDGLNERIHWGLLQKIDTYERVDPLNTKWSLQIGDWV